MPRLRRRFRPEDALVVIAVLAIMIAVAVWFGWFGIIPPTMPGTGE